MQHSLIKLTEMKKLIIIGTALGLSTLSATINAQPVVEEIDGHKIVAVDITNLATVAPISPLATEEYVKWGYCDDDIKCNLGFGKTEELKAAIYVPRSVLGAYGEAQVYGVRFGLGAEASNCSVFLIEGDDLNASPKFTANLTGTLSSGFHQALFRVPYQIENNIIVGYTSTGGNHLGTDGGVAVQNGCYVYHNGQWGSIYKTCSVYGYGSLCIQLLLGGDAMPDNEMAIGEILTRHVEQYKTFMLEGTVHNLTTKSAVQNYEITTTFSNGLTIVTPIDHIVGVGAIDTFKIELPAANVVGKLPMSVSITKVNGNPDADMSNNTLMTTIDVIEEGCYFPRMLVAEEGTSTKCGYCPRGIVVMESMKKRFPDTFIGIAVHCEDLGWDPMIASSYEGIQNYFKKDGLPNGVMNRRTDDLSDDPIFFEKFYEEQKGQLSEAKVTLVKVGNVNQKTIDVETEVVFDSDIAGANYRLAYVLLEDGVQGYEQENYFYGGNYGQMGGWENIPSPAMIEFNDVARGIWNLRGIPQSLPSNVFKKTPIRHTYTLQVPDEVQAYENLRVVAMVMNASANDEIVNATQSKLGVDITGIENVTAPTAHALFSVADGAISLGDYAVEVFTLDGRRVANNALATGVYIARALDAAGALVATGKVAIR